MEQFKMGRQKINVGEVDRMLSIVAGTLLARAGLRRGWFTMMVTALGGYLVYRGLSGNCKVYEALDMDSRNVTLSSRSISRAVGQNVVIDHAVMVRRSPAEVYLFWRNLENLPRFMDYLQSVSVQGEKRSHWVAKVPFGAVPVQWDAEITEDVRNERISWASLPGSTVMNSGTVEFRLAPDGASTQVHLRMQYTPPGGSAGVAIAKATNKITAQTVAEDMRRFKEVMELGEGPGRARSERRGKSAAGDGSKQKNALRESDVVHEASEQSFPASDPPSYSGGKA